MDERILDEIPEDPTEFFKGLNVAKGLPMRIRTDDRGFDKVFIRLDEHSSVLSMNSTMAARLGLLNGIETDHES